MARTSSFAQHYLECDSCEENPAQYFCKMCAGHLCEPCKCEHGKKKITRNHEIVSLTSKNEDMVDQLNCTRHTKKKLECYCNRCREPICTECIIESHNGYSVKSLSTVYKELTDHFKQEKEEIDKILLPRHNDLLAKEKEKRKAFTKKANRIQMKIDAHIHNVVEMVNQVGRQTVTSLLIAKNDGLREMDTTTESIEKRIIQLHQMSKQLSAKLEAKPDISFFNLTYTNNLKRFQSLPTSADYTLTDFRPQHMNITMLLGKPPVLQSSNYRQRVNFEELISPLKCFHNLEILIKNPFSGRI